MAHSLATNNKFTVLRFLQDTESSFSKFTPTINKWYELQQHEKSYFRDNGSGSTILI